MIGNREGACPPGTVGSGLRRADRQVLAIMVTATQTQETERTRRQFASCGKMDNRASMGLIADVAWTLFAALTAVTRALKTAQRPRPGSSERMGSGGAEVRTSGSSMNSLTGS